MTSGSAVREPLLAAPPLVTQLGQALRDAGVVYCQWKGHLRRQRWASGEGDIDLLIDPSSAPAFTAVLGRLGFHATLPAADERIPGVESFFGYDPRLARLLHVHAHYRLVVGRAWASTYRLPLERALLATAVERSPFPIPQPVFEFVVLVLRSILGRSLRQDLGRTAPRWLDGVHDQVRHFAAQVDLKAVHELLQRDLPCIEPALFDACLNALRPGFSPWRRALLRRRVVWRLRPFAQGPALSDTIMRIARQLGRRRSPQGKRLARGGTTIALLGADGSGKSTCTTQLYRWLSPTFDTLTAHMGRPPRSLFTLVVGGLLRLRTALWTLTSRREETERDRSRDPDGDPNVFPGYLALLRHVCTARDRYLLYLRIRRFATAGGVALAERYPIEQNYALAGPCVRNFVELAPNRRFATLLRAAEEWYYRQMLPPDHMIVLRVDPELAVRRKTTEPSDYVRRRARIVWDVDWRGTSAQVVDAGRPLGDVLADLKTIVWSAL
ncbi:MAG TPA: hypothetical protein VFO67_08930 [Gemmatimonadales bacterium]|nr:hypothetical protein [Gemmatimonadales bacterium]